MISAGSNPETTMMTGMGLSSFTRLSQLATLNPSRFLGRILGQLDVEGDEVGLLLPGDFHGSSSVVSNLHLVACLFENIGDQFLGDPIVFDYEYLLRLHKPGLIVVISQFCG